MNNEEYMRAYEDPENLRILERASYKYKNFIDVDDMDSCKMVALWKCLEKYNPKLGNSFKNSLYRYTIWECKSILRKRKIQTIPIKSMDFCVDDDTNYFNVEILDYLSESEKQLMLDRFVENRTFKEISKKNSWSLCQTKRLFNSAVSTLRGVYINMDSNYSNHTRGK